LPFALKIVPSLTDLRLHEPLMRLPSRNTTALPVPIVFVNLAGLPSTSRSLVYVVTLQNSTTTFGVSMTAPLAVCWIAPSMMRMYRWVFAFHLNSTGVPPTTVCTNLPGLVFPAGGFVDHCRPMLFARGPLTIFATFFRFTTRFSGALRFGSRVNSGPPRSPMTFFKGESLSGAKPAFEPPDATKMMCPSCSASSGSLGRTLRTGSTDVGRCVLKIAMSRVRPPSTCST
jgi:hypothetical protein